MRLAVHKRKLRHLARFDAGCALAVSPRQFLIDSTGDYPPHDAMSLLCSETAHIDYIATLLPIATFALSLAVGFVTWAQLRVARNKLRLDLFDRRWRVFEATSKFVNAISNDPRNVGSYLNDFKSGTSNAEFLFDSDVVDYIKLVRERAVDMQTAHTLFESERKDEAARIRNIEKFASEQKWLIKQVQSGAMTKSFASYLSFANIKA
jgi:hypothetical protein